MRYWDFLKKNLKSDMLTLIMIHVTFIRYHLQLKEWKSQLCRSFENINNKSKKKFSRSNAVIFLFCSKIAAFHVHEKQIKLANVLWTCLWHMTFFFSCCNLPPRWLAKDISIWQRVRGRKEKQNFFVEVKPERRAVVAEFILLRQN